MIDSEALCAEWLAALRKNQNAEMIVLVGAEDGIVEGCGGEGGLRARLGLFKGFKGAVEKVGGTGDFKNIVQVREDEFSDPAMPG